MTSFTLEAPEIGAFLFSGVKAKGKERPKSALNKSAKVFLFGFGIKLVAS
jgi:hypothetical protein